MPGVLAADRGGDGDKGGENWGLNPVENYGIMILVETNESRGVLLFNAIELHNIYCGQSAPYQVDSRPVIRLDNDGNLVGGAFFMPQKVTYACADCGTDVYSSADRKTTIYCHRCSLERSRKISSRYGGASRTKKSLIKEHGKACQGCGQKGDVMLHHITPISKGGTNAKKNCILLCQDCHRAQHEGRGVGRDY